MFSTYENTPRNLSLLDRCAGQRKQLTAELDALSDSQLDQIGTWRGAISTTVSDIVAGQGCSVDD